MEPLFEIKLQSIARGKRGAARSVYQQIRAAIIAGRLAPGSKLPATRQAVAVFRISRNTIASAYDMLLAEGLVEARRGSGTYVARVPARVPLHGLMRARRSLDERLNPFWERREVSDALGFWWERPRAPAGRRDSPEIDFRPGIVDSRLFPFESFRKISGRELRRLQKVPPSHKGPQGNQGNHRLRQAIVGQIALTRAIACRADDVLITSGAQQAFDLLARVLVKANETVVAIEDPGYPPLRVAFAAAGAKLAPVGVDEEGLIVDEIPADAGVICVCPSHQFPLGVAMSPRRRQALIDFARRHNAVVIEDDYDAEFRHDGEPIDALRSSRAADVVFYVGTFSKCMLPNLRLGFVIASEWAMPSLIAAKNCADWHCSVPVQLATAAFIAEGHLRRHVRKLRSVYQVRRETLLRGIADELGDRLVPIPSPYGMHVTAVTRQPEDLARLTRLLARRRVLLHSLDRYHYGRRRVSGIVFGLGVTDQPQIRLGLAAIERGWRSARPT